MEFEKVDGAYVYAHVEIYVYIQIYTNTYLHIFIGIHIYIYMCIYMQTHRHMPYWGFNRIRIWHVPQISWFIFSLRK